MQRMLAAGCWGAMLAAAVAHAQGPFRLPPVAEDSVAAPDLAGPGYAPPAYVPPTAGPPSTGFRDYPPGAAFAPLPPPGPLPPPDAMPPPAAGPPPTEPLPPGPAIPAAEPAADEVVAVEPLVETGFWPGWATAAWWLEWDGSVELGLSGEEGNNQAFSLRTGAKAKRTFGWYTHTYEATYLDKTARGVQVAQTALFDARLERRPPETRWSSFAHFLTEYDEFKAFDVRLSGDAGLAYHFLEEEDSALLVRAGGSTSRELGGPDDSFRPELVLGLEASRRWSDTHKVSFKVDYFPDVTAWEEFRLNTRADWEFVVAPAWGVSVKLSVIDRYDSTPLGARPNDLDYSCLLLWSF